MDRKLKCLIIFLITILSFSFTNVYAAAPDCSTNPSLPVCSDLTGSMTGVTGTGAGGNYPNLSLVNGFMLKASLVDVTTMRVVTYHFFYNSSNTCKNYTTFKNEGEYVVGAIENGQYISKAVSASGITTDVNWSFIGHCQQGPNIDYQKIKEQFGTGEDATYKYINLLINLKVASNVFTASEQQEMLRDGCDGETNVETQCAYRGLDNAKKAKLGQYRIIFEPVYRFNIDGGGHIFATLKGGAQYIKDELNPDKTNKFAYSAAAVVPSFLAEENHGMINPGGSPLNPLLTNEGTPYKSSNDFNLERYTDATNGYGYGIFYVLGTEGCDPENSNVCCFDQNGVYHSEFTNAFDNYRCLQRNSDGSCPVSKVESCKFNQIPNPPCPQDEGEYDAVYNLYYLFLAQFGDGTYEMQNAANTKQFNQNLIFDEIGISYENIATNGGAFYINKDNIADFYQWYENAVNSPNRYYADLDSNSFYITSASWQNGAGVWFDSATGCELGPDGNPDPECVASKGDGSATKKELDIDSYIAASVQTLKTEFKTVGNIQTGMEIKINRYFPHGPRINFGDNGFATPRGTSYYHPAVYLLKFCANDEIIPPACDDEVNGAICEPTDTGTEPIFHESDNLKTCTIPKDEASGFTIIEQDETTAPSGNSYCEVACKEDLSLKLPTTKETVSGQYFLLDKYTPQIEGKRTCVTTNIDYDAFDADLKTYEAESNLVKKYNLYQDYLDTYNHLNGSGGSINTSESYNTGYTSENKKCFDDYVIETWTSNGSTKKYVEGSTTCGVTAEGSSFESTYGMTYYAYSSKYGSKLEDYKTEEKTCKNGRYSYTVETWKMGGREYEYIEESSRCNVDKSGTSFKDRYGVTATEYEQKYNELNNMNYSVEVKSCEDEYIVETWTINGSTSKYVEGSSICNVASEGKSFYDTYGMTYSSYAEKYKTSAEITNHKQSTSAIGNVISGTSQCSYDCEPCDSSGCSTCYDDYYWEEWEIYPYDAVNDEYDYSGTSGSYKSPSDCDGGSGQTYQSALSSAIRTHRGYTSQAKNTYQNTMIDYQDTINAYNKCFNWTDFTDQARLRGGGGLSSTYSIYTQSYSERKDYFYTFAPTVKFYYPDPDQEVFKKNTFIWEGYLDDNASNYSSPTLTSEYEERQRDGEGVPLVDMGGFNTTNTYWSKGEEVNEYYNEGGTTVTGLKSKGQNVVGRTLLNCTDGGQTCTSSNTIDAEFYDSSYIKREEDVVYFYHLPQLYSVVPNGTLLNEDENERTNLTTIALTEDAVPININTKAGTEEYTIQITEIEDKLRLDKKANNPQDNFDERFYNSTLSTDEPKDTYVCEYKVVNDIYIPDEGINFFYRIVDPADINPVRRTLGYNWNDNRAYAVIDRMVEGEADYMVLTDSADRDKFEFTLTPVMMKEIRSYNARRTESYIGGYSDWDLSCSDYDDTSNIYASGQSGYHCYSNFLTCLASGGAYGESGFDSCESIFGNTLREYGNISEYDDTDLRNNRQILIDKQNAIDALEVDY